MFSNNTILKISNILLQNKKNFKEFRTKLELFYNETERTKPTNEDQEQDIEIRKAVLYKASTLYNTQLEIHAVHSINLMYKKKKIVGKNWFKILIFKT